MRAIRVAEKSADSDNLLVDLADRDIPKIRDGECLIEVHGSGVNPSDVKALLGKMPNLVWPRTPGRDYAGIVVEGPSEHIGKEVWGTGGDLGMRRNGGHAEFNVVDAAGISAKPKNLTMHEAGSVGVSWTCAWLGMIDGADVQKGETAVILGANGKVGEASIQLASAAGAQVIAIERARDDYAGHASAPVEVVNLEKEADLRQAIMDRTDGKGADVIMNTVGSPYFDAACNSLAKKGRQIIITTIVEDNLINLRTFYRGNYRMIGVSNMDHNNILSAEMMDWIRPGFEAGVYQAFPIKDDAVYRLDNAIDGYTRVLKDLTRDRIVIDPKA